MASIIEPLFLKINSKTMEESGTLVEISQNSDIFYFDEI